jgi:hypothetical protein
MGVTIAYRGRIADLSRIEEFEDRLVDFALEFGGMARIWRTWADSNPERMVRGVIVDIAPEHESASLLVSPRAGSSVSATSKTPNKVDSRNLRGASSRPCSKMAR